MKWRSTTRSKAASAIPAALIIVTASFLFYSASLNETVAIARSASAPTLFAAPSATFNADPASLGAIPDHVTGCDATGGPPRNVTFTVSGLTGSVTGVELTNLTFGSPVHSWMGDVEAVLIAPNGASHTLFGRTLATTATSCGDSTDLAGPYTFADSAAAPPSGGWWQAANVLGAAVPMTSGAYRSTANGGGATNPQPPTSMNPSFASVTNANGTWTLRLSDHGGGDTGAVSGATLSLVTTATVLKARADFDGDGKTDLSVFRPSEGNWYLNRSTAGFTSVNWGLPGDIPTPGDFDGDNKADTAIFRPSTGVWWIQRSTSGTLSVPLGTSTDVPVVGDYNGDGKSDIAVYRPSNSLWFIQLTGGATVINLFGAAGDLPVPGDYNGDGTTDIAIYRPSTGQWWVANSGGATTITTFGVSTDRPVPADYDGDNKDDIAIWRPSNGQWWIVSSLSGTVSTVPFGLSTDIPVPGDYDGDGRDDQAIYRNGVWWINQSTSGITAISFGISTDIAIPSKYIP